MSKNDGGAAFPNLTGDGRMIRGEPKPKYPVYGEKVWVVFEEMLLNNMWGERVLCEICETEKIALVDLESRKGFAKKHNARSGPRGFKLRYFHEPYDVLTEFPKQEEQDDEQK